MTSLLMEAVKVELGVEQITFPDYAACLSVKTYLHMCGLNFTTELKINAEEMSPSGKVPFIQIGPFLISEMEPIISAVQTRVTRERYGCMQPWPLNRILPCKKYFDIKRKLSVVDWLNKSFNEVCEEVITCCEALSERLGTQDFFFGKKPTELDALVFGHLFTLLTTDLPNKEFAQVIGKYDNLVQFCKRVDQKYYKQLDNDY
ncbi:MTX2-like protein [Mya arenaria]|uniref:MTX2-like protein n=1 Tax=Mya arenaria TaxID=6604 RepID=A0ABY7E7J5_MYAAR|nr:MTX2-like protein [Mya arenaria]